MKNEKKGNNYSEAPILQIKLPRRLTIILTVIALGIMIYYFHQIGISDIIDNITTVNLGLLSLSIFLYFLAKFWDSLGWREILKIMGINPRLISLYRVHITSLAGAIALPSAGTVETGLKMYLGHKEFHNHQQNRNATFTEILSSVVVIRTIALFLVIPLSLITAIGAIEYLNLSAEWGRHLVIISSLISILLIVLAVGISIKPTIIIQAVKSLTNGLARINRLESVSIQLQNVLLEGIEEYKKYFRFIITYKGKTFLAFLAISMNNLFVWMSTYFLVLAVEKDSHVPFLLVVIVVILAGFLDVIPLGIPNAEGLKEITITALLERGGISPTTAAASAVLLSLTRFYLLAALGIVFLFSMGFLKNSKNSLKDEEISTKTTKNNGL
ncbi:MAG: lysylphosphatidylglycerol synthase transmembrane domain-containing protein [Promethearchaeota archaeon]